MSPESGINGDISSLRIAGKSNTDILLGPEPPHQPITVVTGERASPSKGWNATDLLRLGLCTLPEQPELDRPWGFYTKR